MRWARKAEMCVRVHPDDGCCNGRDKERTVSVDDMDAIIPQMGFADEGGTKARPGLAAD